MIHFTVRLFDRCAAWLLIVVAGTAPWFAGAQPAISRAGWWYVAGLAGSLVLVLLSCLRTRAFLRVPKAVLWAAIFLLACLAWWATQPEPNFPTSFPGQQWAALKILVPGGFIDMPRGLRLATMSSLLFGLIAAAHLGADARFRRILSSVIGWTGLSIAGFSLCQRLLQWNHPWWVTISSGQESYNAAFFHYSCAAACVNLAWPLLVFREKGTDESAPDRCRYWTGVVATAGLVPVTIALWPAEAAKSIALVLALSGCTWFLLDRYGYITPKIAAWTVIGGFTMLLLVQALLIRSLWSHHNDGWRGAEAALVQSSACDARLSALAAKRRDRLIPGQGWDRQAAWLATLRMISDHPFLGDGPGSRSKRLRLYTNDNLINSFYLHLQFAHHDLFQTAAEWGLVPLACWLTVWSSALRLCVANAANSRAILLALLGVALHGLVDFPLQVPALQMWTALLLGLAVAPRGNLRHGDMDL